MSQNLCWQLALTDKIFRFLKNLFIFLPISSLMAVRIREIRKMNRFWMYRYCIFWPIKEILNGDQVQFTYFFCLNFRCCKNPVANPSSSKSVQYSTDIHRQAYDLFWVNFCMFCEGVQPSSSVCRYPVVPASDITLSPLNCLGILVKNQLLKM